MGFLCSLVSFIPYWDLPALLASLLLCSFSVTCHHFCFTLFHEIGHVNNGDYGISFEEEKGKTEEMADTYAQNMLIDPVEYKEFIRARRYDAVSIKRFAARINRDPGIILGRLQNDGRVGYNNKSLNSLKREQDKQPCSLCGSCRPRRV